MGCRWLDNLGGGSTPLDLEIMVVTPLFCTPLFPNPNTRCWCLLLNTTLLQPLATKQNKLCELPTDPQSGLALLLYQPSYLCFSTDNSKYIRLNNFFYEN